MTQRTLAFVGLALILGCGSSKSPKPPPEHPKEESVVVVVAEPRYYVSGAVSQLEMRLFTEPDPNPRSGADGFILEVVEPPEYAGKIIGMHHDGLMASGDPYKLYEIGRRYELKVPKDVIGKLTFGPCSLMVGRKLLPK